MNLIGYLLSRPRVANWIIKRAQRMPYFHLDGYMNRWWLFNGYEPGSHTPKHAWFPISIRIHHILREDYDRALHDHPWNARTFILKGCYTEEREGSTDLIVRMQGDTARLKFGEYHTIRHVSTGGVYTLFIVGRMRGMWGFKVDGVKVPYKEYDSNGKRQEFSKP